MRAEHNNEILSSRPRMQDCLRVRSPRGLAQSALVPVGIVSTRGPYRATSRPSASLAHPQKLRSGVISVAVTGDTLAVAAPTPPEMWANSGYPPPGG